MHRSLFSWRGLGSLEGRAGFLAMAVCLRAGLSGIIVIILMSEQILFLFFDSITHDIVVLLSGGHFEFNV